MTINFKPTRRQRLALTYLWDAKTNHILYGGSLGSGKSYLGCMWVLMSCFQYPGTRYLIGRSRLNNLKRTTLKTLFDIIKYYNLKDYVEYNAQTNTLKFNNGSEIILIDLYPYPQDPDYDRLGSLEITGAFIDELSEISYKGFEVLGARIRYRLLEYGLIPKLFAASNPCHGWPKNYFYTPYEEQTLPEHIKFIPALPTDNPHLSKDYLEHLDKSLDNILKQRLLHGSWSFEDDEYVLFQYDKLQQSFYNEYFLNVINDHFITCDPAELGIDRTIITLWHGWNCIKIIEMKEKDGIEVAAAIKSLMHDYRVPINNVIVDSVGVGTGVSQNLKGSVRYSGAERPLKDEKFVNIKSQLMWKFAEKVNNLEVNFNFGYNDKMIQECLMYKKEFINEKFKITSKDTIKRTLGRSPDIADALYLRAYFEYKVGAGMQWKKLN